MMISGVRDRTPEIRDRERIFHRKDRQKLLSVPPSTTSRQTAPRSGS
jgi:hypothetical protein